MQTFNTTQQRQESNNIETEKVIVQLSFVSTH